MSLQSVALIGEQEPRLKVRPDDVVDLYDGEEAVALASGYGLTADPWQADTVSGWMARGKDGRLAAGRCGLAVPRQNGKNGSVEIAQLHKMVVQGRRILHTAHEVKTARKAFQRLCSFFENNRTYPELVELVKEIRRTNGQESIVLLNGASVEFVARSRGSGRGYTVDDLFCDEAQELSDEQLEALLPTIAAAPSGDPQIVFLGTPPPPGSAGEVFSRVRIDALSGDAKRLCWDEWSIPDDMPVEDALSRWPELAYGTNPAMGRRLGITTVTDESVAMSPEGFCRERLGQWALHGAQIKAIPFSQWSVLAGVKPDEGRVAFGVKFTPDGSTVALAGGIRPDDGPIHVEAFRQANLGDGLQWLTEFLVKRADTTSLIVVDGKSGAGAFVDALKDAGLTRRGLVVMPSLDQVVSAHSMLLEAVAAGTLSHLGQDALDDQVKDAVRRQIGKSGAFGWDPDKGDSVALLDAVTFAFWGAKTARANPSESRSAQSARRAANRRRV